MLKVILTSLVGLLIGDNVSAEGFTVNDPNLKVELVAKDLDFPTSMAFLGENDILVLEKDKGTVQRIVNGQILDEPLLDLNVTSFGEHGLVGITVAKPYVFLYYTESETDEISNKTDANRVYRYEYSDNKLTNPKIILELPSGYNGKHNGGKLVIGPDKNLYLTVGDVNGYHWGRIIETKAQNNSTGPNPDSSSGILRVTQNGNLIEGILGDNYPSKLYYAYGIRNSFGLDFDPVTGNLWDTENGDYNGDEINLVEPGFNSGSNIIEGFNRSELYDFNGKGKYSDPEFAWYSDYGSIGPTAIKFLNSDMYGQEYKNDMLVGDFNYGNIYHFDLIKNRTGLALEGSLIDKIASEADESLNKTILAHAAGPIIDIQVSPNGYIYYVSLDLNISDCDAKRPGCLVDYKIKGSVHKILPKAN